MPVGGAVSLPEIIAVGAGGLVLGRTINLALDRLPTGQTSPAAAGARGDYSWFMGLLPLVGHLWSSRRGGPGHRLARLRPPAVEAVAALVGAWATHQFGVTPSTGVAILYSALFIHLAFADLEHSTIPNWVVLPALPLGLALFPLSPLGHQLGLNQAYISSLGGGVLGFGLMLLVYVASRGRLGGGDVKLAGFLGVTLGVPHAVVGLIFGVVAGGLAALALLALGLKSRTDTMPYGPALIGGAAVVLLGGTGVAHWCLQLFQ